MNHIRLRETFRSVIVATRENTVTVSTISYGRELQQYIEARDNPLVESVNLDIVLTNSLTVTSLFNEVP